MRRVYPLLLVLLMTACGTTVSETFGEVGENLPTPTSEETPSASAEGQAGTFVVVSIDGVVDGPGLSLAEAVDDADGDPKLVAGVLLMDNDGVIWLCDEVVESSPPECSQPRLRVENYPEGGAEWNLEDAELTGLQEADGVRWFDGSRLFGVIQP